MSTTEQPMSVDDAVIAAPRFTEYDGILFYGTQLEIFTLESQKLNAYKCHRAWFQKQGRSTFTIWLIVKQDVVNADSLMTAETPLTIAPFKGTPNEGTSLADAFKDVKPLQCKKAKVSEGEVILGLVKFQFDGGLNEYTDLTNMMNDENVQNIPLSFTVQQTA